MENQSLALPCNLVDLLALRKNVRGERHEAARMPDWDQVLHYYLTARPASHTTWPRLSSSRTFDPDEPNH